MARAAGDYMQSRNGGAESCRLIDLAETPLPPCDGHECYKDPAVNEISDAIKTADGILLAGPVYNYDFGSNAKNLIELTGQAWADKIVGIMCAAGSNVSYMAPMQIASSLMLDFRSLILPRFVFATGDQFQGDTVSDSDLENRIKGLVDRIVFISQSLKPPDAE